MTIITTTSKRALEAFTCLHGYQKYLEAFGQTEPNDDPVPFSKIVEIGGLYDGLWGMRHEPQHERLWRDFAVSVARGVPRVSARPELTKLIDIAWKFGHDLVGDNALALANFEAKQIALKEGRPSFHDVVVSVTKSTGWAAGFCASRDAAWEAMQGLKGDEAKAAHDAELERHKALFLEIVGVA